MLADQTYYNASDNSTAFAPQFKPLTANTSFRANAPGMPFTPEMPQKFSRPAPFAMTAEIKSFVPQTTNTPSFTPVSPMTPATGRIGQNMSASANPFTFTRSEGAAFVPSTPSPITTSE